MSGTSSFSALWSDTAGPGSEVFPPWFTTIIDLNFSCINFVSQPYKFHRVDGSFSSVWAGAVDCYAQVPPLPGTLGSDLLSGFFSKIVISSPIGRCAFPPFA
jgi:hypothetical protein